MVNVVFCAASFKIWYNFYVIFSFIKSNRYNCQIFDDKNINFLINLKNQNYLLLNRGIYELGWVVID